MKGKNKCSNCREEIDGSAYSLDSDPLSWYRWPILPVKKLPDNRGRPEFGFLINMYGKDRLH